MFSGRKKRFCVEATVNEQLLSLVDLAAWDKKYGEANGNTFKQLISVLKQV